MRAFIILLSLSAALCICLQVSAFNPGHVLLPATRDATYYLELAKIHERYGVCDKAIEMYLKAIELQENKEQKNRLLVRLGKVYLNADKGNEAEGVILRSIEAENDPAKKIRGYFVLAEVYEKQKKPENARKAYEFILYNCNESMSTNTARDKLTKLLMVNGELQKYTEHLQKKHDENPEDLAITECLAHLYSQEKATYQKAILLYEKIFMVRPADRETANRLALLYKYTKNDEKAVNVYIRLITSAPDLAGRYYFERISNIYLNEDKPEEALKWDLKCVEEDPDNVYIRLRVAERYQQLKKDDIAKELYLSAIELASEQDEKELLSIKLVDFYINTSKLKEAEELSRKILETTKDERIRKELESRIAIIAEKLAKKEREGSN